MTSNLKEAVYDAALTYVGLGYKVFPISGDKVPYANCDDCRGKTDKAHREVCECLNDGFARCHGFYSATLSPEVIEFWLDETPEMGLAISLGKDSGVFVFEYDPKNGGDQTYADLVSDHGAFPDTRVHLSPSGGQHFYFLMPNFEFGSIQGKQLEWPGIDIKSTGGYACLPPTEDDRGSYSVVSSHAVVAPPQWLRDALYKYQSRHKWTNRGKLRASTAKKFDPETISDQLSQKVQDTIEYWTNRIRTAEDGNQNILIYTGGRALFSLAFHGLVDEDTARLLLEEACEDGNHPPQRTAYALDSAYNAAMSDPDEVDHALSDDINILETFKPDDIGNANRVVFWSGTDIRFDPDRERFYVWEGRKWVLARDSRVRSLVEDVISKIVQTEAPFYSPTTFPPSEIGKPRPKSYREVFSGWAGTQRFAGRISSCMAMLTGRQGLWCETDDFDIEPLLMNVSNGVVDLRTGDLLPHARAYMCTQLSKVEYDHEAKAPNWARFIELVQPNEDHRKYLQRLAGYTFLGEVRDQIFAIHIGSGGNGKGVFLDIMKYLLGEYATMGQRDTFVAHRGGSTRIPADVASYDGKRMVVVDELNDNQKMNLALVKELTGGSEIKAESKNTNPWEYTPKFTLHFRTNGLPDLPSDKSILRRFRLVRWGVEPTEEEWDSFTDSKHSTPFIFLTRQESSGILNWVLEGAREYLEFGLQVPEDLEADAVDMLQANDPFLIFMSTNTVREEGQRADGAEIYRAFKVWYEENGFDGKPPSSRTVYKEIKEGKYKGTWEWDTYRERFHLTDVLLKTLMNRS